MDQTRKIQRQPITVKRDCVMDLITFNQFDRKGHQGRIVDISRDGVCIESNSHMEPGFVWFRDRIWGQHSGEMLWSKQAGTQYRSGIRFAPLPPDAERFVSNQMAKSSSHEPLRDLHKIVVTLFESMKQDTVPGN